MWCPCWAPIRLTPTPQPLGASHPIRLALPPLQGMPQLPDSTTPPKPQPSTYKPQFLHPQTPNPPPVNPRFVIKTPLRPGMPQLPRNMTFFFSGGICGSGRYNAVPPNCTYYKQQRYSGGVRQAVRGDGRVRGVGRGVGREPRRRPDPCALPCAAAASAHVP